MKGERTGMDLMFEIWGCGVEIVGKRTTRDLVLIAERDITERRTRAEGAGLPKSVRRRAEGRVRLVWMIRPFDGGSKHGAASDFLIRAR